MTSVVDPRSICHQVGLLPQLPYSSTNVGLSECQETPGRSSCYASGPNDVWSLGIILVNLTCGRNPWKRASLDDSTYRAYRNNPKFLSSILPLSAELDAILGRIFEVDPRKRIGIDELRNLILGCPRFTTSNATPPLTPPSEPVYMPEAPVNDLPGFLQPLGQYPVVPNVPILPTSCYPVVAQSSTSSEGSSLSDSGSTFSATSSCSSSSSCGSFVEVPYAQESKSLVSQQVSQFCANYPMEPIPNPFTQPFLAATVQVC